MTGAVGRDVAGASAPDLGRPALRRKDGETNASAVAIAEGREIAQRLLDGDRAPDAALSLAVDAALLGQATHRAVHAAALLLAYSTLGDLRLSRAQPKRWVLGLDELIDRGHLDAAEYAVGQLNAAFPRMPYLEHMMLAFRRLPAPVGDGRPAFADDRRDVQVVPMPGADTVILAFCGMGGRLGLPLSLIDRWFARLGSHVVYLRDPQRVGYTAGIPELGRDIASTIDSLTKIVSDLGARRVVCTGTSAGGSGALRYARGVGAERVLAMSPITGGPEILKKIAPDLPPGGETPWTDLVPLYRDGAGIRVRILYGANHEQDREQALRMEGLPNVSVQAIPGWDSHHLAGGLLRTGRLQRVLRWLTRDDGVVGFDGPRPRAGRSQ